MEGGGATVQRLGQWKGRSHSAEVRAVEGGGATVQRLGQWKGEEPQCRG